MTDTPERISEKAPLRLAIIEDEPEFRKFVRRVAEGLNWRVEEYENGRDFVQAHDRVGCPDLILLDMVMPELGGIETVGWLASLPVDCPIVLVSGKLPTYLEVARELGTERGLRIADVLHKPLDVDRLRTVLKAARGARGGRM
jgi:CheY-like chemotaxis protein